WPQVNEKETTNQQLLPDDMMSVEAADIIDEEFSDDAGTPLLLVWHRDGGLEEADYEMIQTLYQELSEVPLDKQEFVPPFHQAPVEALIGSASEDEEALTTPVFFDGGTTTDEYKVILEDLRSLIEEKANEDLTQKDLDEAGLHVRFSGPVGIQTDTVSLFSNADMTLLMAKVAIVYSLIIILYLCVFIAFVTILSVLFCYIYSH